jgi:hypothetical protein
VILAVLAGGLATALAANNAAPAAAPNPNCTLIVPANPLTATGLATPFQLTATDPAGGPCNEANANQSAFAEAAILSPAGQLTLYDPLVIDQGTQPAAPTVTPQIPAGSTVGIWFGFNGTNLTLQSANGTNALQQGNCVNGLQGSIFGQFSYCNAPAFFTSANQQIQGNMLQVPPLGTAKDGMPCPTTRDFSVVDQDQSDNVVTHYLATGNGTTAQNNANSKAKLQGQNLTDLANGSDNLLLNQFIDPALGCTPFTRPDQSSDGMASGALPLDELSAAANQAAPIALVPQNDPMVLNNNAASVTKTNLYRQGVDQMPVNGADTGSGTTYCQNFFGSPNGIQRVFKDMAIFQNAPSVDAAMASNLFTFLAMRANQSFTNLGCQNLLNVPNPITLTTTNGVVTAATFTPLGQKPAAAATCTATAAANGNGAAAATTPAAAATTTTTTTRKHRKHNGTTAANGNAAAAATTAAAGNAAANGMTANGTTAAAGTAAAGTAAGTAAAGTTAANGMAANGATTAAANGMAANGMAANGMAANGTTAAANGMAANGATTAAGNGMAATTAAAAAPTTAAAAATTPAATSTCTAAATGVMGNGAGTANGMGAATAPAATTPAAPATTAAAGPAVPTATYGSKMRKKHHW